MKNILFQMKRLLLILPLLFFAICIKAQETRESQEGVRITSFELLQRDLTANLKETEMLDQNNKKAALIKIMTTQTGFGFECGSIGIVKTEYKTGEIWLYVQEGTKKLTIKHPIYGVMRDYHFPLAIESARTYEMHISLPHIDIPKGENNFVAVTLNPADAELTIDDVTVKQDAQGYYTARGAYGRHTYKAAMEGYYQKEGTFTIVEDSVKVLNIDLIPITARIHINCPTPGSQIYVDNTLAGKDSCTVDLAIGKEHDILAMKEGFRYVGRTITVNDESSAFTVELDAMASIKKDAWNPKSAVFLSTVVGGPEPLSYGIRAGWCAKVGVYIKARSNFDFTQSSTEVTPEGLLPDGTIFAASNNSTTSYLVGTAGIMLKAARWMYFYGGLGYSSYNELWESADDSWAKVSTTSGEGLAADLGAILKIKYLTLSAGITYSAPEAIEGEVGIGIAF